MDHYQIIAGNFQATIESLAMSVDDLADPLSRCAELLSNALLQDHKVLVCGNGVDAALAQLFSCNLLDQYERDRPALPVLNLTADSSSVSAICNNSGLEDLFSRQIRALGQEGDVLLCIDSGPATSENLHRALSEAYERGMASIFLTTPGFPAEHPAPIDSSVKISLNLSNRARTVEIYTMIINCLCELLDNNLFGPLHGDSL